MFTTKSGEEPQIDHQKTITRRVLNNYQSFTYTGQFQPKQPALNFRIGVISGSEFSKFNNQIRINPLNGPLNIICFIIGPLKCKCKG